MKVVLDNVTKVFQCRKKDDVVAVKGLSFEIPDGKLVALLGPSGCGKSTTLNLICGLEKPTEGKIFFDNDDVTDLPPELRGIGIVFQNYALYPHLTVRQNILFPLQNLRGERKMKKEQMEEKMLSTAKLVQIESLLDRKPSELSGGQQQRVAIARALVKIPNILLLDEPLSNLDARLRIQTREEIRRIQAETKITTVFVTHDQDEAMSISDYIIVMDKGEIQQIGKPQEVYDDPINLFVARFLGTPPINVFTGRVSEGGLYLGNDRIVNVSGIDDGEVTVAIRPEGFIPDDCGKFTSKLSGVEVMGRDTTIIATHPSLFDKDTLRAIVSAEQMPNIMNSGCEVKFRIRKSKIFVFDKESGKRLTPSFTE